MPTRRSVWFPKGWRPPEASEPAPAGTKKKRKYKVKYPGMSRSEIAREMWKDPLYKEKITMARRKTWQDPEYRAHKVEEVSKMNVERWKDPEFREEHMPRIIAMGAEKAAEMEVQWKEMWKDPETRKEKIEQLSASQKELIEKDPDMMKRLREKRWEKKEGLIDAPMAVVAGALILIFAAAYYKSRTPQ